MYKFAVIGIGVIGALISRELTKYTKSVVMLEAGEDVASGASKANSAIVHGGFDPKPRTLKARLNVRGTELISSVTEELSVPYKQNGSLVIATDAKELKTVEELYARGIENGVKGLEIIDKKRLSELEPEISDNAVGALFSKTAGIVCPYELTVAAAGNAMDNGAELLTCFEATAVEKTQTGFTVTGCDGRQITAEYVINCAGIFADKVAGLVNDYSFSLKPRYGEYMLLDKSEGARFTHTLFQTPTEMGKGVLVTPTVDGNLLIGPTAVDGDDRTNTSTTATGLEFVRTLARKTVKSIDMKSVITSFSGIRAVPDTGDFIIGESTAATGFFNVAGIESPGLSSSPAIAEYVAQMLTDKGIISNKRDDYNGLRKSYHQFKNSSVEEKNKAIAADSRYGHIVCRCETVTEGEIVSAIHQNPPTHSLDALKRRLRVRMGRCQGGFCTPALIEILARELDIPPEKVTLHGNGSELVTGRTKEAAK